MTKEVPVNGTVLTVEDAGRGHPIIFLHAGVADRRMWQPQFERLKDTYRVVRWDWRGFGDTPHVPGPFSYASDVLAVMDGLGIERATLIGCSMGGSSAIRVALREPDRVARLVLIGSGLHGFERPELLPPIVSEMQAAIKEQDWHRFLGLEEKFWIIGMDRDESDVDPDFLTLCRDMMRRALQPDNGAQAQDARTSDMERLGELHMPVLSVIGEYDTELIWEVGRMIAARAQKVRMERISDTAHLPSLERPERFEAILDDWLRETSPAE